MYQPRLGDITYEGYPIQYPSAVSLGVEDIDITDIWNSLASILIREKRFTRLFYNLMPLLEVDLSSVRPRFEIKNETALIEESVKKAIPEDMLEFDIVVRMPPMKEWTARVRVKSIEKATPHIVEPEGI